VSGSPSFTWSIVASEELVLRALEAIGATGIAPNLVS
jgi:hypothetical protein